MSFSLGLNSEFSVLGQSCESVAVKASHYVYPFEHRPVKGLLEAAHLSVKCVKVHSKGNKIDCND